MKMRKFHYFGVILAGGTGERMNSRMKQFINIDGKPLIYYSLEAFFECDFILKTIIVVPDGKIKYMEELIKKYFKDKKFEIVIGGSTRKASTYNALLYIKKNFATDFVIIHDAARPLISKKEIKEVVKESMHYGFATVGVKAIDLIFEEKNKFVDKAINKEKIYYGFTPQCFLFEILRKAHEKYLKTKSLRNADNIELIKKLKPRAKVKIIDRFYPNIKLTYPADIPILENILRSKQGTNHL